MAKKPKPIEQIHYYDAGTGYVHYTSAVPEIEGADMRVFDAVSGEGDLDGQTLQRAGDRTPVPVTALPAINAEALAIAAVAQKWLNNVMTNSRLRDPQKWSKKGRAKHKQRLDDRSGQLLAKRMGVTR